ncbi:MAG TPA: ABC transporter substrate-binding protein [Tissierellia bacterium]|nr:ABC transporter substrate-binding protein [Tissierellia bacterium]
MKRSLLLLIILSLLLSACQLNPASRGEVVNVYNWGEYIDKDLLTKFEDETGIRVIYSNFNTNEDLYVKLKSGGTSYDVVVPSDYMIERMINEDMLREINWDNVPNMQYVDEEYQHHSYDPFQLYSAPYFWGTMGIVYNTTLVDEAVDSWSILWDEKYAREIIMLDSSRDSIGVALAWLGYSMNSRDPKELEEAKALLIKQYPLVYAYLVDQTRDIMINGEAALAVMYSGDAVDALDSNEDLVYAIPKEGSNLWFDAMVIPKTARNPENAEKFINFMLEPENAALNSEYVWYSLPSTAAKELLSEELRDNEVAYPSFELIEQLEVFRDPGSYVKHYDEMWQEIKNQ